MSYRTEFPHDFTVPLSVLHHVKRGRLEDTSWHNDTCPSFLCAETSLRLWVDHPLPAGREWPERPRYGVVRVDEDLAPTDAPPAYEGDDLEAALAVLLGRESREIRT